MRKKFFRILVIASIASSFSVMIGGCAKQMVKSEGEKGMEPSVSTKVEEQQYGGMGAEEPLETTPSTAMMQGEGMEILEGRTSGPMLPIYFDFDRSGIREDQKDRIKMNGEILLKNTATYVRIEGNCDERGTNEYNMALGERRAMSAKKFLMNMGIAENRLTTISYGEEKPLNRGHDELAWSQNRRDDFVFVK